MFRIWRGIRRQTDKTERTIRVTRFPTQQAAAEMCRELARHHARWEFGPVIWVGSGWAICVMNLASGKSGFVQIKGTIPQNWGTGVFRNTHWGPATGPALRFFSREIR
jgi:hypothetical protein